MAFVPAVFAASMIAPDSDTLPLGVPSALGCSGTTGNGVSFAGWAQLNPSGATETTTQPVGTDGFFPIDARAYLMDAATAQASMTVAVTDDQGAPIPGKIKLLEERGAGSYLFGWLADAPLAVGTHLQAMMTAMPSPAGASLVGGTFNFIVAGPPEQLPKPTIKLDNWWITYRDAGDPVSCDARLPRGGCSSNAPDVTTATVASKYGALASVTPTWEAPKLSTLVAWEADIYPSSPDELEYQSYPALHAPGTEAEVSELGSVVFPKQAAEYCITFRLRDLKTAKTTTTEVCAPAGEPKSYSQPSDALAYCLTPPTADSVEAWCNLQVVRDPDCVKDHASAPDVGEPATDAPTNGDSAAEPSRTSRTSTSCQLGGSREPVVGGIALALGVLLLSRRRARSAFSAGR